jgi:hypothetical protein
MWRVRGSFLASLKPHSASSRLTAAAPLRQWTQQDVRLSKQLANFSSDRRQVGPNAQETELQSPRFNQGDEAMKITRVGMYVNVAMAATKVRRF